LSGVLLGDVVFPVLEVGIGDDQGAEVEDGLRAGQAPCRVGPTSMR
jgi:hypothetical protein